MTELRNIKWRQLAHDVLFEKVGRDALLKSHSLQWSLTTALRKQGMVVLDDGLEDTVIEYKGLKYKIDLINYPRIFEAYYRYWIDGLKKDDLVLDVGANIGSFSVPASARDCRVYAIEPMFGSLLKENLKFNLGDHSSIVVEVAVGPPFAIKREVDCLEYKKWVTCVNWTDIFTIKTDYTVIRLDCGGEEKSLDLGLLPESVRQLEVEFHFWDKKDVKIWYEKWAPWLIAHDFGYKARWSTRNNWLYLTASKELDYSKEVDLIDGSFRGENLKLWMV